MDTVDIRRFYAEEIRAVGNICSDRLIQAFATVEREHFLGPGPWSIVRPSGGYRMSPDPDPKHLYHNVLVAIDPNRDLNNGHPSSLAIWLDSLALCEGMRVFHIGGGVGYYSAIIAHVIGDAGRVLSIELDEVLAKSARENLSSMRNVEVVCGDGTQYDPGLVDAIFVNAGITHPTELWLDRLSLGGRLLCPITISRPLNNTDDNCGTSGLMLLVVRHSAEIYAARFISPVNIFPCVGGRDLSMNERLINSLGENTSQHVKSLRRDAHHPNDTCWLHMDGLCLSKDPPQSARLSPQESGSE
jgi:protein-L-isoaspartate(D-aspartate) O-methyltransferase